MSNAEILVMNIQNKAKEKGMNVKELAVKCGLGVNAIYQISGKQGFSCFSLAKIADELDCSTDYLLGRSDR
ncbi:MAG: helix-turn-helix transcriptional regulator [Firmicutes bacterium]|nr:helix-turn-helix transcriptional regulator [Bacillota bacterium]